MELFWIYLVGTAAVMLALWMQGSDRLWSEAVKIVSLFTIVVLLWNILNILKSP